VNGHEMVRDEELAGRLVVWRGASGNSTYDEGAKCELIELCRDWMLETVAAGRF